MLSVEIDGLINGVTVPCLVDTGSMVSTITESFFLTHFASWGQECLHSCHWLQLWAANGLSICFIGYLELSVLLCGKEMSSCWILVLRDTPAAMPSVLGILGMNVTALIKSCLGHMVGLCLIHLPCPRHQGQFWRPCISVTSLLTKCQRTL